MYPVRLRPDCLPAFRRPKNHVVLLGCGAVGRVIARHLDRSGEVASLLAVDVDLVRAKSLAAACSPKVRPQAMDLGEEDDLRRGVEGATLVVNAALPKFNTSVMKAALDAEADYLDLAGTRDQLSFNDAWRRSGRTALLGMGEDPGLSNVFARKAVAGMDDITAVRIRDGETARSAKHSLLALFSPEVFLEETLQPAIVFRDGAWEEVPPLSGEEVYPFPPPVGPVLVYNVNHEEVETLPRFLEKGPRLVDFKLALLAGTVAMLRAIQNGEHGRSDTNEGGVRRAFIAALPPPSSLAGEITGHACILVDATGHCEGERLRRTLWSWMDHEHAGRRHGATATSYLTGTGAAVGALLLLERHAPIGGVFVPEQLDPAAVLTRLSKWDVEVRERVVTERRLTQRSSANAESVTRVSTRPQDHW